jgi:hypothetical protein
VTVLQVGRPVMPGSVSGKGRRFSHYSVHTGFEVHPAPYPLGTEGYFPGVKRPEREADPSHLPPMLIVKLYL